MRKNIIILYILFALLSGVSAQVTIGSENQPHESAILDLYSSDKGFLGPRVSLKGKYDNTTIPNPAPGLLVLNISQPDISLPEEEKVYPYRFYYWVDGTNPKWERFIGHDELEYWIAQELAKISVARPVMLYMDGKDLLADNEPGFRNFMSGVAKNTSKEIPLRDSINHSGGTVRLKTGTTSTIVFEPGMYNIVFAYLFIPTTPANINCNVSSYFMDFPFYFYSGNDLKFKSVRVYSNTYHNIGNKSSHAGSINFISTIAQETEWDVKLGAGPATCTTINGFSVPNRNTFLYITKVGDW